MKKMYISAAEVVPSGGTRNFTTMTPVATSVSGKTHWYVGYGNASGGHVDAYAMRTNDTGKLLSFLRFGDKTGAAYR